MQFNISQFNILQFKLLWAVPVFSLSKFKQFKDKPCFQHLTSMKQGSKHYSPQAPHKVQTSMNFPGSPSLPWLALTCRRPVIYTVICFSREGYIYCYQLVLFLLRQNPVKVKDCRSLSWREMAVLPKQQLASWMKMVYFPLAHPDITAGAGVGSCAKEWSRGRLSKA